MKSCKCSDICDACVKGKMSRFPKRFPFPKVATKKENPLNCVVSDICEKPIESIGKSRYFITFTDLFSGYTEIAMIRKKSEAAE